MFNLHVQLPEGYVKLSHFSDLLKLDTVYNGLRTVPKLSANHIEPNNLQRMNVRLAVQVCKIQIIFMLSVL